MLNKIISMVLVLIIATAPIVSAERYTIKYVDGKEFVIVPKKTFLAVGKDILRIDLLEEKIEQLIEVSNQGEILIQDQENLITTMAAEVAMQESKEELLKGENEYLQKSHAVLAKENMVLKNTRIGIFWSFLGGFTFGIASTYGIVSLLK